VDAEPSPVVPLPRPVVEAAQPADALAGADDVTLVHGWLRRCTASIDEAEELTIAVLRRAGEAGPDCVAAASRQTRLQFLTVLAVLGQRGIV
jgi:hypothetical protein